MAGLISRGTPSRQNSPHELAPLSPQQVAIAIVDLGRKFWATADPAWRLKLADARHEVVRAGFSTLAAAGHTAPSCEIASRLADRYTVYREEQMFVFPGAHDAIDALKAYGVKLALVTNGAAGIQRAKVERFALTHRFDHIQIEGEHGFGKPDDRAYQHAMQALGVTAPETWMVGDNLEWEVKCRSGSASSPSGWTFMAKACPRDRPSSPIALSVHWPSCCPSIRSAVHLE